MRVYLIKHGQSQAEKEDRYTGHYEDHLSEEGKIQAKNLWKKFEGKDLDKVFVSPRIHCVDTAYILEENNNAELHTATELAERRSYGILTGVKKEEAKKTHPELVEEIESQFPHHKIEDAEDYYEYTERMLDQFNKIVKDEFEKEKIHGLGFITHSDTIKIIFREVLGFEVDGIKDCAVFELEFDGHTYEIIDAKDLKSIEPVIA
jgi:probable phosphoglycerate mutase